MSYTIIFNQLNATTSRGNTSTFTYTNTDPQNLYIGTLVAQITEANGMWYVDGTRTFLTTAVYYPTGLPRSATITYVASDSNSFTADTFWFRVAYKRMENGYYYGRENHVNATISVTNVPLNLTITPTGTGGAKSSTVYSNFISISGDDIYTIFADGSGGTPTGFKVDGTDLNQIFRPIGSSTPLTYDTGFKVLDQDLRYIFAPYLPSQDFVSTISGTTNVTFSRPVTASILLVGGGGAGGKGYTDYPADAFDRRYFGSSGGSGGEIIHLQVNLSAGTQYTINYTIGNGGDNAIPASGGVSNVTIAGQTYDASGGGAGVTLRNGFPTSFSGNSGGKGYYKAGTTKEQATSGSGGIDLSFNSINYKIGGGGGGGGGVPVQHNTENYPSGSGSNGGGAGSNGTSGVAGTYGGGGGGSGYSYNSNSSRIGGKGGSGVLLVYFTNT